ncbi:hypothetical protein GF359_00230, partial [candidate division WOR-3 bacterium]|nr:hypothetical protein [candidate division WOR-3 bacterium]
MVLEFFTATWCPPCATAAAGAVTLHEDHPDELLVVKYHCNDEFSNSAANGRISYYHDGSFGIPEATFDGTIVLSGSGGVSQYESTFQTCKATQSPITLELTRPTTAYNSTSGSLQAVITNTSDESVSGT